ncbi:MarR family transcriptional regulator [Marinomonas ushuaiensis DSM 15871]|uniref:MarR family transcriptional regulator n=1 Tax=Marinomonas ushuaiensis DSM 15871 TaxID=1122207 RepID=X7E816_9GAMM|nr:MarR family transcriptional regulator [Marinomonas ushuaiensis]ETX12224.1 MarR family transcriptional regulator [Marinomonas ushuaiensis DSM 15871]
MKTTNLGFLMTDIVRLMRREYQKSPLPMTPMQARALVYVARSEGIKQVTLAEMLDIQPITLARLIDQLVLDNLVERRADPKDRRAYGLYLTEHAAPCLKDIDVIIQEVRVKALKGLTEEQAAAAISALEMMRANLLSDFSD